MLGQRNAIVARKFSCIAVDYFAVLINPVLGAQSLTPFELGLSSLAFTES